MTLHMGGGRVVSKTSAFVFSMGLSLLLLVVAGLPAGADAFELPGAVGWSVWEAEEAQQEGRWEVSAPDGAGERYVEPVGSGEAALAFPFETRESTILRVRPVWWRNGEQRPARRFPYPLVREPGPDVVDRVGTKVFCTAPAAGRVVVFDAVEEKVVGFVEVGGYLTDLVADREARKVYVADGLGDRVVVIDAGTLAVVREMAAAGSPWSLALDGGTLYVACRDGKRVIAVDAATGEVRGQAALSASPINVEVAGGAVKRVIVRFQQATFDVLSLEKAAAEKAQFLFPGDARGRWLLKSGCGGPGCACGEDTESAQSVKPHEIHIVRGEERKVFDVSAVTQGPAAQKTGGALPERPGPAGVVWAKGGDGEINVVCFTSPSRGLVGVFDVEGESLEEAIEVGGYPVGLALDASGSKLYVADAAGDRVVVIDIGARRIEGELPVSGRPWGVALVSEVALQREEFVPPTEVNRLFVTCQETRELAVVSLEEGAVAARLPMPAEPRSVKFVPMPNPGWWSVMADDRIPFALRPRVAVELNPAALDAATLKPSQSSEEVPEDAARRTRAEVPAAGPGGGKQIYSSDGQLVLGVKSGGDDERWVDLSPVADPQRAEQRPLTGKEEPGTISVSLDGGPEFDWAKGVWATPDGEMFLVNGSEEFWRYNAPSFRVGPGRHVLRVRGHSDYARVDGVAVCRSAEPELEVRLVPEPREVHGRVPLPSYHGVFHAGEPVRFTLEVSNRGRSRAELAVSCSVRNYMGEVVCRSGGAKTDIGTGETGSYPLQFSLRDTGRFRLAVKVESLEAPRGQVVREWGFVRLPKLEHPRLFWRAEEEEAIRARIARRPNLYRRYAEWLERMVAREGRFPELFLPPGPTADECGACAPETITNPGQARNEYGWRNYELGWRILAVQFAERFLKHGSAPLEAKIKELRSAEEADQYVMYHHHGPFFPGAAASLVDLAPDGARESLKLHDLFAEQCGNMEVLPWTLATLEEPLTPEKRGLIYELMTWENNAERYFETHRGKRGGTWWMDPYTWCHCPMHGYTLSFLMLRNFFGEPRLFEKPIFKGYLTFHHYADPIEDRREVQPKVGGPGGEPWRWIFASLAGHPLEKRFYDWEGWVKEMEGPVAGDEGRAVDRLMALKGRPLTGPMTGHANHFVSGVSVPIALALGWYDPEAAEVEMAELPPTAVFEVEGWAAMRSGWDEGATEVTFISGVREHTTRHKPNHFTIVKGGEYLIGTPALYTDDGNNLGAWGNTVVVGKDWVERWRLNLQHCRDGEHLVINRFSPAGFSYIGRDRRLVGYRPAENGWGGGLNLHGHTETLFMQEGRLLAYQTWPDLDYAAGDASNAWPCDEVERAERQLVFVKPDVVVIYDRVELGPDAEESSWIAATGPELEVDGSAFRIGSGSEFVHGCALLPEGAGASVRDVLKPGWEWQGQKLLEIRPAAQSKMMEYLVVMRVGGADLPLATPNLILGEDEVRLRMGVGGRLIEVRFKRGAECGGAAVIGDGRRTARYELQQEIVDSYEGWGADSRYEKWVGEARFGFVAPEG